MDRSGEESSVGVHGDDSGVCVAPVTDQADGDVAFSAEDGEDDDHNRFSLIAKLLPADDEDRAYVFEANLLEKEIEMYFEVRVRKLSAEKTKRNV